MLNFTPSETKIISASTTSSSVTFTNVAQEDSDMEIQNAGSVTAFLRWGTSAQTAVVTDYPLLAGQSKLINKGLATIVAAITATGTATIYVTEGKGD
jgi:hypothetical protein